MLSLCYQTTSQVAHLLDLPSRPARLLLRASRSRQRTRLEGSALDPPSHPARNRPPRPKRKTQIPL